MKRIVLFSLLLLSAFTLPAQSLTLSGGNSPISATTADYSVDGHVYVTNSTGSTLNVIANRITNNLATGHESYFCWAQGCYPSNVSISPQAAVIAPGATDSTFKLTVNINGMSGTTTVTMSFYPENTQSDSTNYTFVYNVTAVGIEDEVLDHNKLNLATPYPNPANEQVTFAYTLGAGNNNGLITVTDLTGRVIKKIELSSNYGVMEMNIADVAAGVYFVTLQAGDEPVETEKLVIE